MGLGHSKQHNRRISQQRKALNQRRLKVESLEARRLMAIDLVSTSSYVLPSDTPFGASQFGQITPSGRFAVFASDAENLVTGDTNQGSDVFVRDLDSGSIVRANTNAAGEQADHFAFHGSVSDDGRFVLYESRRDTLNTAIMLKDLQTGAVRRIDVSAAGEPANQSSHSPFLSANGRYAAFVSNGSNLVVSGYLSRPQVYVVDLGTGAIQVAATNVGGAHADRGVTDLLGVSDNGERVMFISTATNLAPGETTGRERFYVKDLPTGVLRNFGEAYRGRLSGDGEHVAISKSDSQSHLFRGDFTTGALVKASVDGEGRAYTVHVSPHDHAAISANGRFLAFHSRGPSRIGEIEVYLKDMETGALTLASVRTQPSTTTDTWAYVRSVSEDGNRVLFASPTDAFVANDRNLRYDLFLSQQDTQTVTAVSTSAFTALSGNAPSRNSSISADGRFVAFASEADNLVADSTTLEKILLRDMQTGAITLVSPGRYTGNGTRGFSQQPQISDDGRFVLFTSNIKFESADVNSDRDAFIYDAATDTRQRLPINLQLSPGSLHLSGDGRHVAFWSDSATLVANDTNGAVDLFVLNVDSGVVTRANTDAVGNQANQTLVDNPLASSLSFDGRYIAFASSASNLVVNDTNGVADIFRKDLQTGAVELVSFASGGESTGKSSQPSLSADGRYLAFLSLGRLDSTDHNSSADVYVRDLQTGELVRASTSTGGATANASGDAVQLSANGRYVTWRSGASNLVAGDTNGRIDVFVRDLQSGTVARVNPNSAGDVATETLATPQVSNTGMVSFDSESSALVSTDPLVIRDIFLATLDLVPPGATISSNVTGATSAESVTFTVDFDEDVLNVDVSDFELLLSAGLQGNLTSVEQSGTRQFLVTVNQLVGEGSLSLTFGRFTDIQDAAGNRPTILHSDEVRVDRNAPTAPTLLLGVDTGVSANDQVISDSTPLLRGVAEPFGSVAISNAGGVIGRGDVDADGNWEFTVPTLLAEGVHLLSATTIDEAGNTSVLAAELQVTIDTVSPQTQIRSDGPRFVGGPPIRFLVRFEEDVFGFNGDDVFFHNSTVTGDLVATVTGSGREYLLEITGVESAGELQFSLPRHVIDRAGNGARGIGVHTIVVRPPSDVSLDSQTIVENMPPNSTIGTFTASDPDSAAPFTFQLVSGEGDSDNAFFNISDTTLRTSASLSYEYQSTYSIRVRTLDQGSAYLDRVFLINVTDENEAPLLIASRVLPQTAINEDDTNSAGTLIEGIIGEAILDDDTDALRGIAVTGVNDVRFGTWQYSLGTSWQNFGTLNYANARLLPANGETRVRFVPRANYSGSSTLYFTAWDQTTGTPGGLAAIHEGDDQGGTTAFSLAGAGSSVQVNAVNDAPVLNIALNPTLPTIAEDAVAPAGASVQSLLFGAVTEGDYQSLRGIAVTGLGNTSQGTWQYLLDGTSWAGFGSITTATARLLPAEARVRFIPRTNFNGQVRMYYRAWDQAQNSADGTFDLSQGTSVGGSTAFSVATEFVTLNVNPVNDAPLLRTPLQPQLTPINEGEIGSPGSLIKDLIAGTVIEADANSLGGIAVIGAASGYGRWEYALSGDNWLPLLAASNSTARLLPADATTRVRFVPTNLNYNGAVRFNYRLWDQTQGTVGSEYNLVGPGKIGGRTAFSSNVELAQQNILAVNDAPVLTGLGGSIGYQRNDPAQIVAPGAIVRDLDSPFFTGGQLRVRISAGASAANTLSLGGAFSFEGTSVLLNGTHVGTLNANPGQGTTPMLVTFSSNASRAIVQQMVRAITFSTTGPVGIRTLHFSLTDNEGSSTGEISKSVIVN